jgi:hypothetical protein
MPGAAVRRTLIAALLCMTACSSDDDAGSSSTAAGSATTTAADATSSSAGAAIDQQRQAIVAKILADSGEHGFTLDEACLSALVAGLSESDVGILATSATDPSGSAPTSGLSSQAEAMDVLSCSAGSTDTALVAEAADVAITAASTGTTQTFDRACVETAFTKLSDDQLNAVVASKPAPTQEALQPVLALMIPCLLASSATSGS